MENTLIPLQTISIAALAGATLALLCCAVSLAIARRARSESRNTVAVTLQLEKEARDLSRDLDAATERANEQARRLSRLEVRFRTGEAPLAQSNTEDVPAPAPAKPTMTERRHHVLSLAKRGLDTNAISSTLNLPRGEVELIIGLSRAA